MRYEKGIASGMPGVPRALEEWHEAQRTGPLRLKFGTASWAFRMSASELWQPDWTQPTSLLTGMTTSVVASTVALPLAFATRWIS